MKPAEPHRIKTISEYHRFMALPQPEHPLISVIRFEQIRRLPEDKSVSLVMDFYSIALKRNFNGMLKYGQQVYDFDGGMMTFMAPGQVMKIEVTGDEELKHSGWLLLVHPDFLWGAPLARQMKGYEYFGYSVAEALHLSEKEEETVTAILQHIAQEYHANIDTFSQGIIITQLGLLLNYADRFYHRQFLTRKISSHKLLTAVEEVLDHYFNSDLMAEQGLPTVQYVAGCLHVSPDYLSSTLRILTGQNTQQHIHEKLIEKAKEKLSGTDLSVSEIAWLPGFEHPQSFSKLFRTKAGLSPLAFRQSFS